uniref:Orphan protein n=1 Tax=Rheinheimera sp. BAL341 TaxID=1708203 RepID=A0A486XGA2_9GAMM
MKHISLTLLSLATANISAAQPVNTTPCYAAGEAQNYTAVLSECPALAAENDMFAHFFMATAIINSKTRLFDSELSADERAQRTFTLPTEEKIAISDAKQHLEAAVEQGHTNSHFLLGYILLETQLNMLPPSGRAGLICK